MADVAEDCSDCEESPESLVCPSSDLGFEELNGLGFEDPPADEEAF